jgi:hypothetical protein
MIQCVICGIEFEHLRQRGRLPLTCSNGCRSEYKKNWHRRDYINNRERILETRRRRYRPSSLPRYRPCIICGIEFDVGRGGAITCSLSCRNELRTQYDRIHKKTKREYYRQWYAANREQIAVVQRLWREANRDKINAYHRRRRAANIELVRAKDRQKKAANRGLYREINRRSYYRDHERTLERNHRKYYEVAAALKVYRELIGPCSQADQYLARRVLQQLGEIEL